MLGFLLLGLLYAGVIVVTVHRSRRTKAVMVFRHLEREGTCSMRIGPFASVWTPERSPAATRLPMGFYQMPGRGRLTYTLADNEVRLVWQPKRGSPREWSGPVPVVATVDYQTTMHHGMMEAAAVMALLGCAGTVLGAFTGSVLGGLASGLLAGVIVGSTAWSARQLQAFRAAHERLLHPASAEVTDGPSIDQKHDAADVAHSRHPFDAKVKHLVKAVYWAYGAVVTVGFLIGFVLASGTGMRRFVAGVIGLLLAVAFLSIVGGVVRGGAAVRAAGRRSEGKTSPDRQ